MRSYYFSIFNISMNWLFFGYVDGPYSRISCISTYLLFIFFAILSYMMVVFFECDDVYKRHTMICKMLLGDLSVYCVCGRPGGPFLLKSTPQYFSSTSYLFFLLYQWTIWISRCKFSSISKTRCIS